MSKRSRDTIDGESVQLYTCTGSVKLAEYFEQKPTELKPRPNLPVVEPSWSFKESPRRERLRKSLSVKTALLYARRAGPWYSLSLGSMSSSTEWVLSSRMNRCNDQLIFGHFRSSESTYHFCRMCIVSVLQQFTKHSASSRIVPTDVFEGCRQALNLGILPDRLKYHPEYAVAW
jgi:hypothetical protein